ncbi:unnamed protein product [Trichogramma brassicae]|uniref:Uncharacterized protein n=1 Tax=Trichogramma brassicae TaxID=86971 RepID=A0A6H5HX37_9HYME|nr:unnamed protein product [Trichogramma brassicae]
MHHERQKLPTNPTNIERLVMLILQHKFKTRFRSIGWKSRVIRTWKNYRLFYKTFRRTDKKSGLQKQNISRKRNFNLLEEITIGIKKRNAKIIRMIFVFMTTEKISISRITFHECARHYSIKFVSGYP